MGNAVLRCGGEGYCVEPLERERVAQQIKAVRDQNPTAQISVINLAWPSLSRYSASSGQSGQDDAEWRAFRLWMESLAETAAAEDVRFFQIGSGIEPYALRDEPTVGEPYLSYAKRKDEIWKLVQSKLIEKSWRLRLHFLFGPGEARHRFVPSAILAARSGAALTIGAPERRRCWLHVDAAAAGLLAATTAPSPENWDICGASPVSFSDLIALIEKATGCDVRTVSPQAPTADAGCPVVRPTAIAPFMTSGEGAVDDLSKRIDDYARALLS